MNDRKLWGASLGLGLSWLPALLGYQLVARVSGLYRLGAEPHPYFQPSEGWLLYCFAPLVIVSSFSLFLSPGALLAIALDQADNAAEWIVFAFGHSLVLWILLSSGAKLLLGSHVTSALLLSLWLGATAVIWLILALRLRAKRSLRWPIKQRSDARRIAWLFGVSVLGIVALVPKIFWENFNIDGIEAFEFGRSLGTHLLPHWDVQDGVFGFYQNFLLFAYPNHWFIALFGPYEASVRVPYLLYLGVLFAALVLLIEWNNTRRLSAIEEAALWLGLVLYTVVQAYNTTYEPFFTDMAEPGVPDSLLVVCYLSTCYALWAGRTYWFYLFAFMSYLAAPGGSLLLVALIIATSIIRPPDWRDNFKRLGRVISVCIVVALAYELLYHPLVLGGVKNQFSSTHLLARLYPPTVTEFVRLNAIVFPSGILPVFSIFGASRKDFITWLTAVVAVIYFGTIYFQVWTNLHQFTPIMILPLIVFWRMLLGLPQYLQGCLLPAVAVTTVISIYCSLPRHFQINGATREIGFSTSYRIGNYERGYEDAIRGAKNLYAILPKDYRLHYPQQPWGADAYSWIHYAMRDKPAGTKINYVVQASSGLPPPGSTGVSVQDGVAVYVQDINAWRRDRERHLPRVSQSPLYEPIYRRTYQFFRAYAEGVQKKEKSRENSGEK